MYPNLSFFNGSKKIRLYGKFIVNISDWQVKFAKHGEKLIILGGGIPFSLRLSIYLNREVEHKFTIKRYSC